MTESKLLENIRRWSLWAVLGSAAVLLVLALLVIWGAVSLYTTPDFASILSDYGAVGQMLGDAGDAVNDIVPLDSFLPIDALTPQPTGWLRLILSFGTVLALSGTTLVALWIASWVKRPEAAAEPAKKPAAKK